MTIRRFDVTEDRACEYEVYGDMVQDSSGAYVLFEDYHASHAYDEAKEREPFEAFAMTRGWEKHHFKLREDGNYEDWGVNPEWQAWKACAKSRARSAE